MSTNTATLAHEMIYSFEDGDGKNKALLGGKGAGLAEMTHLGIPVPPGFTITTEVCMEYNRLGRKFPDGLEEGIRKSVAEIAQKMGKGFGDPANPLLVSVRSGAKISMPGMMDTVLNLGLNDVTVEGLAKLTHDARFAYDAYRRFISMYGDVVMGVPKKKFEHVLKEARGRAGVKNDNELSADQLKAIVAEYKQLVQSEAGASFPIDVYDQLHRAVRAVFDSWNNPRAIVYRNREHIDHNMGTAVNIQSMVFGNMGNDCGTGVAFTRDCSTGASGLVGDFLINAQGEDVVAGIRTPQHIDEMKAIMPKAYQQLLDIGERLEKHYKETQDVEFTIEKDRLFMLQTRRAKRTATAAVKIAVDMVHEGLVTREEAVARIQASQLDQLLHPYFEAADKDLALKGGRFLAKGIPASPGAATGKIVFEADEAVKMVEQGDKIVLVRPETTPDDAHGMVVAEGILTSTGGPTSHAALVARGWGIPCVVGCEALQIDMEKQVVHVNGKTLKRGDVMSFDGTTGEVLEGTLKLVKPEKLSDQASELLSWADSMRTLGVYANADNPRDAGRARAFGAHGIGLCRTEHMFMERDRLPVVQRMILAAPDAERLQRVLGRLESELAEAKEGERAAVEERILDTRAQLEKPWAEYTEILAQLQPVQRSDFRGILKAMEGNWVIIRLLDPPLHEFLPSFEELLADVTRLNTARRAGDGLYQEILGEIRAERQSETVTLEELEHLLSRVRQLKEQNPMLGLRVCRLGIVYPEIYKMQVRAILEAACELVKEGVDAKPEIMIPGVGLPEEMAFMRELVTRTADDIIARTGVEVKYKVGTMVELPRACVVAGELAKDAQFFSFGTNDLTQTTLGYSRDDAAGTFIPVYIEKKILGRDPFQTLDTLGVGPLMRQAVEAGRKTRSDIEIGICGEHGGEPRSVAFCHSLKLNYVSCSPYRVPIARLAAAKAALAERGMAVELD
jgi:pyruvate,orthophosphate dikinase